VVARTPSGEADGTFRLPWNPAELDQLLDVIKSKVLVSSADVRRLATEDE
jgi:hypothetical protein